MTTLPVNSAVANQAQREEKSGNVERLPDIPRTSTPLAMRTLEDVWRLGVVLAQSGMFNDVKSAAQSVVKIMTGRELGLGPMASMRELYVSQNGRVTFSANLMASLIKSTPGYDYKVARLDEQACIIDFYRNGEKIGTSELTMDQAIASGMNMGSRGEKETWKRYQRNMLFARTMSNGFRWHTPELSRGLAAYVDDEMQDVAVVGDVMYVPIEMEDEDSPRLGRAHEAVTGHGVEVPVGAFTDEEREEARAAGATEADPADLVMPDDEAEPDNVVDTQTGKMYAGEDKPGVEIPNDEQLISAAKKLDPMATVREVKDGGVLRPTEMPETQDQLLTYINGVCAANGVLPYDNWFHLFHAMNNAGNPIVAPSRGKPWTTERIESWTETAIKHQKEKAEKKAEAGV